MSALEVGQQIAALCREGKHMEAINSLYADNIVSVEVMAMDPMPAQIEGIEAVRGKCQWWLDNHDVHSSEITGPFPHGDRFILVFKMDCTHKPSGHRMEMEEAGLYTVADGKVVREEFFYDMPDC